MSFKQKSLGRKAQCEHDILIWCFSMLLHSNLISAEYRLFIESSGFFLSASRFLVYSQCALQVLQVLLRSGKKEIAVEGVDVFPSPKYVRVH